MRNQRNQQWVGVLLLAGALSSPPAPVFAHPVLVDGVANEWFGQLPPSDNTARIARHSDGSGEFVWRDATGDARGSVASRACDLRQFCVTGDADQLSLLVTCAGPVVTTGDSAWQVQVTFDLNRFSGLGGGNFLGLGAAAVAPEAAWEFAVQTRAGSGQGALLMDNWGNAIAADVHVAMSAAGVCEISIPWPALGFSYPPADPVRMSIASFLSNATDELVDPNDGSLGRAADVVTQYALAGSGNTASELADGVLDHSLDVYFDGRGACIAPLIVNEIYFEGGVPSQWIELVNVSSSILPLSQFKLGDAETPGSNEAMARFPSGILLEPGSAVVVAYRGSTFLAQYGMHADAECDTSDPATPDMLPFTEWASNVGFNIPNSGDAVLVLDRANTVVDVVTYKNGVYPGVTARPGAPSLHSLERLSPNRDTDNCAADFADLAIPTPRLTGSYAGVGEAVSRTQWTGAWPIPSTGVVCLALQLGAGTAERVELLDVTGRRVRELGLPGRASGAVLLTWDGRDDRGSMVSAGIYFARVRVGDATLVQRLIIAR